MARELVLYIASTLDGFIAGPEGELDWLFMDQDYGYGAFEKSVDTVLLGRSTYDEILQFDVPYPYSDKKSYVFTSRPDHYRSDHDVVFTSNNPVEVWNSLSTESGKDVWLVGGGKLISPFVRHNLIDRYIIAVHPVILGEGIKLFSDIDNRIDLKTEQVKTYDSGLIHLFLSKKDE